MRKVIILAATMVLALALAGAAYAASYDGTREDNNFVETPRGDRAVMKAGDDRANGKSGADFLFGNDGVDRLYGEDGSDFLNGGDGEDELVGSRGDDTVYTGTEAEGFKTADEVQCGQGHDVVYLAGKGHASHNLQAGACEEVHSY